MKFTNIVAATLAIGLSSAAMGQVIGKAEDQIRWRQSAYQTMAWNMGRIKANIEGTYNKDQVVQAANVIQAIATSGMGALFQPDTNTGKGWRDTNVKPEFFTRSETPWRPPSGRTRTRGHGKATGGGDTHRRPRRNHEPGPARVRSGKHGDEDRDLRRAGSTRKRQADRTVDGDPEVPGRARLRAGSTESS